MSRLMLASASILFSIQLGAVGLADEPPGPEPNDAELRKASVGGKYKNLLKKFEAKVDRGLYTEFRDYGYSSTDRYANQNDLPPGYWVYVFPNWYIWDEIAAEVAEPADALAFDQVPVAGRAWGPEQATGPPNTPGAGDIQTAWASRTQDGQEEWLELSYEKEVVPVQVEIHETFNPGAVFKVSIFSSIGEEHTVWEGDDPTAVGMARGISKIDLDTKLVVNRIRIYLASEKVDGWNEIDAVGLKDKNGKTQWAKAATASSSFADQQVIAGEAVIGGARLVAQPIVLGDELVGPPVVVPQTADAGLANTIRMREKQMAKLLKQLRTRKEELDKSHQLIQKLQKENEELRQRLAGKQDEG